MDIKDTKNIALIASPNKNHRELFRAALLKLAPQTTIYYATDGSEAQLKYQNVPSQLVIAEEHLDKTPGAKLIETLISKEKEIDTAFVLHSPIPDREMFVNEVLIGKVQFIPDLANEEKLLKVLARALNFTTYKHTSEYRKKYLAVGEYLVHEGEVGESVYILRQGKLRAFTRKGGQEITLGIVEPGEFVGEMAYIQGKARAASVEAITECELIEIPMGNLDQILLRKPAWSKALMATLSKRLRMAIDTQKTGTE